MKPPVAAALLPLLGATVARATGTDDAVGVRYGYFPLSFSAFSAACGRGWLNLASNADHNSPAYAVECFPQISGKNVASRLDNGDLDIAMLGFSTWAEAVARGLDLTQVYVSHSPGPGYSGLYVRPDVEEEGYVGIKDPRDLIDRTIGVQFGSDSHFYTEAFIEIFGLEGKVKVVDLPRFQFLDQWKKAKIDGATVGGPLRDVLRYNKFNLSGRELISSNTIASWGTPTDDVVVARRAFANEHPRFMAHFVGMISRINESFLDNQGERDPKNPMRWDANNGANLLASVANASMLPDKAFSMHSARNNLASAILLDASTQLACDRMGSGDGACSLPTGQHVGVKRVAEFLYQQKMLHDLGVMASNMSDCGDLSSFCGGRIIDPSFLAASRRGNVSTPLGPYEGTIVVDNERVGPDPILAELEDRDERSGRSPFSETQVGRFQRGSLNAASPISGDSNCSNATIISVPTSPNGTFGDGANALPGLSYSSDMLCRWDIYPLDNEGLVEVRLRRLRLWSGDYVKIYSGGVPDCPGGDRPRVLLAQLSGIYDSAEIPDLLPPFRSSTCIRVEFESDGNPEAGYAVSKEYGDGFEMSYSRSDVQKCDCNNHTCDADGLCLCGGTSWGGDCSHNSFCLGTTNIDMKDAPSRILQSSVHATKEALTSDEASSLYPNDLDCYFDLNFGGRGFDLAKVDVYYDIEGTFDVLYLQTGSGEGATNYDVLSGCTNHKNETYYIPLKEGTASLRLVTDDKGRRRGFYAEVSGANSSSCEVGSDGSLCESEHCVDYTHLGSGSPKYHIKSQENGSSVRAMPWAPEDGGCIWEIEETNTDLRLVFNEFDLEPHLRDEIGDKLVVESSNGSSTELFIESCENDDTCGDFSWQDGTCIEGGCKVRRYPDLNDIGEKTLIRLVTDRNDHGNYYNGIDFEVHVVQTCPVEANDNCTFEGGTCQDGGICICSNGIACECACTGPGKVTNQIDKLSISISSVVLGLAIVAFLIYRHRKKTLIKSQEEIIKHKNSLLQQKDAELEVFQLGETKFGDAASYIDELLEQKRLLGDQGHVHKLLLVKKCLMGGEDNSMYVPENLRREPSKYILGEFAGVTVPATQPRLSRNPGFKKKASKYHCLPEFQKLVASKQTSLFEALSLENLSKWDFNIFDISAIDEDNVLLFVSWAVICSPHSQLAMARELGDKNVNLNDLGGYHFADLDLKIDFEILCNYLREVQKDYQASNPYHNAIHAADVVQTLNSIIQMAGDSCFGKEELFSIFFSAAVHDVKHPGMNNNFQVNSMTDLALMHNDVSVLESEHASHAFLLLLQRGHEAPKDNKQGQNDYNFLHHVEPSKFAEIRKRVIDAVLHTDMSRHFCTVAKLQNQMAGRMLNEIDTTLRWDALMFMLHLADISNPAKVSPVFLMWTDRCLEEFFAQGDKEREMELPISPNCNRNETTKPDSQIGFIQFVVKPAFEVLASVIPEVGECVMPQIESNLNYWKDEKQKNEFPKIESA